jgi:hypothetical protein
MAQQPRQQRIGFYGKFTPTALDTSGADKMRALAGLGQTIADTSLSIAKPMVTAERVKQAEIASAETGTIDPETGELRGPAEELAAYKIGAAQANAVTLLTLLLLSFLMTLRATRIKSNPRCKVFLVLCQKSTGVRLRTCTLA